MTKTIHHTFGPHVNTQYLLRTLALLMQPWKWKHGEETETLRTALEKKFSASVSLFSSGREALLALLRSMQYTQGAEIIIQAYTCIVVPNAIHAAGAVPVYAEIDPETLNLTAATVKPCITPRTRAVICQHTFGIPAPLTELRALCDAKNIMLIEDCAHLLPDQAGPSEITQTGDASILSFGKDKALSGIIGGAVLTRNNILHQKLQQEESRALPLSVRSVCVTLLYPLRMAWLVRPFARTLLLKMILKILSLFGLINPILTNEEKKGTMSPVLHQLPNVCASLALHSLKNLENNNNRRRTMHRIYREHGKKYSWPMLKRIPMDAPLQKFPLFLQNAHTKRLALLQKKIFLDDGWTGCVICPEGSALECANYQYGSDPIAENMSQQIMSLPTHPTMTIVQAKRTIQEIDKIL